MYYVHTQLIHGEARNTRGLKTPRAVFKLIGDEV
jgi:hypothetical protein